MSYVYQYIAHYADKCYSSFSLKTCDLVTISYSIHIMKFLMCFASLYFLVSMLVNSQFFRNKGMKGPIQFWLSVFVGSFFRLVKSLATFPECYIEEYYLTSVSGVAYCLAYLVVSYQFSDVLVFCRNSFGNTASIIIRFFQFVILLFGCALFIISFTDLQIWLWNMTVLTIVSYFLNFAQYLSLFIFIFMGQMTFVFNPQVFQYLPPRPVFLIRISLFITSFLTLILISYFLCSTLMIIPFSIWADLDYAKRRYSYLAIHYVVTSTGAIGLFFLALMMFLISRPHDDTSDGNDVLVLPLVESFF